MHQTAAIALIRNFAILVILDIIYYLTINAILVQKDAKIALIHNFAILVMMAINYPDINAKLHYF